MQSLKGLNFIVKTYLQQKQPWTRCCKRLYSEDARDRIRALKPGDTLHGYTVKQIEEVPDLFLTAAMLSHDKTGAKHLHIARNDKDNAFSVTFRTTPRDSTGIPHILEHTILCGSKQFPVHDPFFKMLSRSTATFMNALTSMDWTMYPFSSQNEKDFRNLMSVYMDAVFFPLLRPLDFYQEGWRLEHTDPNDPKTPLIFKGVVYNEMKGVYSNSQNIYAQQILNSMLPSHTYGVVSGGDPAEIPNLTHKQLVEFHTSHYHPSNSNFFTYGDLPLEKHLEFINSSLKKFRQISPNTSVPREPRWTSPKSKEIKCASDPFAADPEKQTTVSMTYLWTDITDPYQTFIAMIIGYLLTEGESSPFYQALLKGDLGSNYSPLTGCQSSTKEALFSIGLQNIHPKDKDKVLKIIDETVDKVIEHGFEKKRLEALLHRIELSLKHETSNFGVHLSIGLASMWNHDGDPIANLHTTKYVQQFKEDLKDNPDFLKNKVKKLIKNNPHRLTLTMNPATNFIATKEAEEAKRLSAIVESLSESEKTNIYKQGRELLEKQNVKEDISCLPSLKVEDLDKEVKKEDLDIQTLSDSSIVQTLKAETNGVSYIRLASNLHGLSDELLPFVPLFCEVITSIDAGGHDYVWISQQQERYTGGLSATPVVVPHHTKGDCFQRVVLFSSHCLSRNFHQMMDLWEMIMNSPDFTDAVRLSTLIRMFASNLASTLSNSGHSFAKTSSASLLDMGSWWNEILFGYSQVQTMKKVAEMSDLSDIIYKLQSIGDFVLNKSSLRMSLNTTPESKQRELDNLKAFLQNIKGEVEMTNIFPEVEEIEPTAHQTHFQLPFDVNYVARSFPAVKYTHKDYAPLVVLSKLMSRKFLHREIREQGGAYGSGAEMSPGVFTFFSYRDPRSLETLDVFSRCVEWAINSEFSDEDVEEAKLNVFQTLDKPISPGNRGQVRFLYDISEDMRQDSRDRTFRVTDKDLQKVAAKYLSKEQTYGDAFLGPSNSKVKDDENWKVILPEESS